MSTNIEAGETRRASLKLWGTGTQHEIVAVDFTALGAGIIDLVLRDLCLDLPRHASMVIAMRSLRAVADRDDLDSDYLWSACDQ